MKNSKNLLLALLILSGINSCKKTNDNYTGGTWSAMVNGQQKSGYAIITYTTSVNELSISLFPSAKTSYPVISVTTGQQEDTTTILTGIYPLTGFPSEAFYNPDSTNNTVYASNQGQLNIQNIDFKAQTTNGTFNFNSYQSTTGDSIIVTGGIFTGAMGLF